MKYYQTKPNKKPKQTINHNIKTAIYIINADVTKALWKQSSQRASIPLLGLNLQN